MNMITSKESSTILALSASVKYEFQTPMTIISSEFLQLHSLSNSTNIYWLLLTYEQNWLIYNSYPKRAYNPLLKKDYTNKWNKWNELQRIRSLHSCAQIFTKSLKSLQFTLAHKSLQELASPQLYQGISYCYPLAQYAADTWPSSHSWNSPRGPLCLFPLLPDLPMAGSFSAFKSQPNTFPKRPTLTHST